jgi:hypothetical protein
MISAATLGFTSFRGALKDMNRSKIHCAGARGNGSAS